MVVAWVGKHHIYIYIILKTNRKSPWKIDHICIRIYIYICPQKENPSSSSCRHHWFSGGLFFSLQGRWNLPPEEKKMRLLELDRELMQVGRFVSFVTVGLGPIFYPFVWDFCGICFWVEIKPELAEGWLTRRFFFRKCCEKKCMIFVF